MRLKTSGRIIDVSWTVTTLHDIHNVLTVIHSNTNWWTSMDLKARCAMLYEVCGLRKALGLLSDAAVLFRFLPAAYSYLQCFTFQYVIYGFPVP